MASKPFPPPKPADPDAGVDEDTALARSGHLARDEVIRRRLRHVNQLTRYYRDQYWALAEDLRARYRRFYWDHGRSPFADDESGGSGASECAVPACRSKAMALTRFCHAHILFDTKQKLYKPCIAPVGHIKCNKPILRSLMPSLCTNHLQKHQRNVQKELKKVGFNLPSSSKPPMFSIIVAECVRKIQAKRRELHNIKHNHNHIHKVASAIL